LTYASNAGLADPGEDIWEIPVERIDEVIRTNLLGEVHGSKVAMRSMLEQGHGRIHHM